MAHPDLQPPSPTDAAGTFFPGGRRPGARPARLTPQTCLKIMLLPRPVKLQLQCCCFNLSPLLHKKGASERDGRASVWFATVNSVTYSRLALSSGDAASEAWWTGQNERQMGECCGLKPGNRFIWAFTRSSLKYSTLFSCLTTVRWNTGGCN